MSVRENTATARRATPHVLFISNYRDMQKEYPASGVFVDRQVSSLQKLGCRISRFDIGVSHSPFKLFRKWLELRRTVRDLHPDIVHAQYGTIVGFLAAAAGAPAIISFCGADLIPSATVPLARRCIGFLLSNLAALLARGLICKSLELKEALWWRRESAVVIPSGVDLNLFSPGPQEAARKELGWDISRPIVLFHDRDPELKGRHVVKAAMDVVRSHVPTAGLQIISNVEPMRMPIYYRAADVLVCASKAEGSPNMVKEALACNLPVVSSFVGDVRERLAGVYPSEIVPREPKAFGEAVAKILLTRQRSNGRDHIQELSLERVAVRVKACYQEAMYERPRIGVQ